MLQTFLTPEKLWPGGIPSSVHLHQNGDLSTDDMKEESKGWCQFVEEEWVPKTDPTEETQQRRALIERWASADQAFRDSYQDRASLRNSPLDYPSHLQSTTELDVKRFFCLASVNKELDTDNYKRLLKLLILLYFHDNKAMSHPRATFDQWEDPQLPYILVDSSTITDSTSTEFFSYHNLLPNIYLQTAEFRAVSMTRSGAVIFPNERMQREYMVINQDSLNEGRVALMTFKPNGELANFGMLLPWSAASLMSMHQGNGWPFTELLDEEQSSYSLLKFNEPLNMDEPLLAIVDCAIQRRSLTSARRRLDAWEVEIERFAPGYLALEAQGRAIDYDLTNLWTEEMYNYGQHPALLEEFRASLRRNPGSDQPN